MKFDVVVANPPFSLDKWGADDLADDHYRRFEYGLPPKSKGDYAFVEHMLSSLNAEGRMGVVLPHGVLFRGASEGKIRKAIIDDNLTRCGHRSACQSILRYRDTCDNTPFQKRQNDYRCTFHRCLTRVRQRQEPK